ncbi:MAG: glycosyltransferase family 4 protein [Acidobacteriota bacterium]
MRIAIDVRKVNDFGIGTYVRNLIRQLPKIDQESDYFLLHYRQDHELIRSLSTGLHLVPVAAANYSASEHIIIPARLRHLKVDLFHSPHYVLPFFTPCRSIVTIHDVIHLLFPQYLPSRMAGYYARYMIRRALDRSELVLTVSSSSKRDLLTFFEVRPEKILVIPNGIDPSITEGLSSEELKRVKERFQIAGRTVLFVGNVKPHKNVERLIAAFAKIREHPDFSDLTLIVVGDEISKYPSLRRTVERHQVRGHVRFFGFVPELTLAALYKTADVFVFPSLYEGFGLPPLEAMANGTPVVTSNISSLPEVVGHAALTVDPYNIDEIARATKRILTDPELRSRLIADGYKRAQCYSWDRSVTQVHQAYQKALGIAPASSETARATCGSP